MYESLRVFLIDLETKNIKIGKQIINLNYGTQLVKKGIESYQKIITIIVMHL